MIPLTRFCSDFTLPISNDRVKMASIHVESEFIGDAGMNSGIRYVILVEICLTLLLAHVGSDATLARKPNLKASSIFVDSSEGTADGSGTKSSPYKSLRQAISCTPDALSTPMTICLAPGSYGSRQEGTAPEGTLYLRRRTLEGAEIRIVGMNQDFSKAAAPGQVCLDWTCRGDEPLVRTSEGVWSFENIQLGSRKAGQVNGFSVEGPGLLKLKNVRIHLRSTDGAGIHAHRLGRVHLDGRIELNEDLHGGLGKEKDSWCAIRASDHGTVQFVGSRGGSLLSIGNGGLRANYYGVIRLGFQKAEITSWGSGQQHNLAIANSGRIDLHGTTTVLRTMNPQNTPIGFEDDGHLLGEGARLVLHTAGVNGILLMKASRFFCYDIEFRGRPKYAVHATSGSTFNGSFIGTEDPGTIYAEKGSDAIIHGSEVELKGPFVAKSLGRICLPNGREIVSSGK